MKIQLPDVTLIAISSIKIPETIQSLQESCKGIDFAEVKLVTHKFPENMPNDIQYVECEYVDSIMEYNKQCFFHLASYVSTSHCLLVQYDSWITNPDLWDNDWLQYDYIGAPWAYKEDAYICHDLKEHVRVGNGGFSLRSKKILQAPLMYGLRLLQEQGYYNEDGNICVYHRKRLLQEGIKYAPLDVACKFSFETPILENYSVPSFGFHKNRNPWSN